MLQIKDNKGKWVNASQSDYDAMFASDPTKARIFTPTPQNNAVTVLTVHSRALNPERTGYSYVLELSDGVIGLFSSLERFETSQLENKTVFYNGGDLKTNRTLNGNTVSMPVFWDLSLTEGDLLTYQENKDKVIADKDTRDFETELAILGKGLASFTASSGNVQIAVSFSELADMRAKMVKDKADEAKIRKARYA